MCDVVEVEGGMVVVNVLGGRKNRSDGNISMVGGFVGGVKIRKVWLKHKIRHGASESLLGCFRFQFDFVGGGKIFLGLCYMATMISIMMVL